MNIVENNVVKGEIIFIFVRGIFHVKLRIENILGKGAQLFIKRILPSTCLNFFQMFLKADSYKTT